MSSENSSFQEALTIIEPLLRSIEAGLSPLPTASSQSLQKLLTTQPPLTSSDVMAPKKKIITSPDASILMPQDKSAQLDRLREQALACVRCPQLVESRTQVVFGVGNPYAELMFVGEAPGEKEDLLGEPFVGRAGQLLTKIITAMEYDRETIFIANVLKCRPNMPPNTPGNRKPKLSEMTTCLPWLQEQINIIKPRVLVALGATALEGLLGKAIPMREARGQWFDFHGIPTMVTYHPAYLLYSHSLTEKRKVWEDMMLVLEKLGRPISTKQRGYFLPKENDVAESV